MNAYGEHVLIQKPNKKVELESGLVIPDNVGKEYDYGRIVSVGSAVEKVAEGNFVLFDPMGTRPLVLHPFSDDGLMVAHMTHIYATVTKEELEARKLPIP